jgi:hypothetical protein
MQIACFFGFFLINMLFGMLPKTNDALNGFDSVEGMTDALLGKFARDV